MSRRDVANPFVHLAAAAPAGDVESNGALEEVGGVGGLVDAALPVMLVLVIVLGLALWLLGRRLARPACALSGAVLGALGGLLLAELLRGQGAFVIPLVIGAAIAGGLIAGLLFRVWMAMSGALVFALLVPAAMVVWQGAPPVPEQEPDPPNNEAPDAPSEQPGTEGMIGWLKDLFGVELEEIEQMPAKLQREADDPEADDSEAEEAGPLRDAAAERLGTAIDHGRQHAQSWYQQNRDRVAAWWNNLSASAKRGLAVGAGIGALLGMTLGLALPYTAAAVQSALAGAVLMFLPLRALVERYAPEWTGLLPQSPRAVVIWLGLITVLGVFLQWTFFHKRRDAR